MIHGLNDFIEKKHLLFANCYQRKKVPRIKQINGTYWKIGKINIL